MKLIIGLGNPGARYKNTRHNVGYMFVQSIIDSQQVIRSERKSFGVLHHIQLFGESVLLATLSTYMNDSGKGAFAIIKKFGIKNPDVCIVHDDLDLPLGSYKIQLGKGPKVHYGIASIEDVIGKNFWRIRIGIDAREIGSRIAGETYVLQQLEEEEKKVLDTNLRDIVHSTQFLELCTS